MSSTKWTSVSEEKLEEVSIETPKLKFEVLADKKFLFFLFAIIPANLVFFQHLGALPLYIVDDLGYTTAAFGLFGAINTVLIIFLEVPLNNWMSNTSYKKSLMIGALTCGHWLWRICNCKHGISAYSCNSSFYIWRNDFLSRITAAYTSEIAPSKRRGEYMGYYQMTFSFAFSAGPWLGTVVYQHYGSVILWSGALVLGLITAGLMFFVKTNPSIK